MGTSCTKQKQNLKALKHLSQKILQDQNQTYLVLNLKSFINDEESEIFKNSIKQYKDIEFLEVRIDLKLISFKSLQVLAESFLYLPFVKIIKLNAVIERFSAIESLHVASILQNTNLKKLVITTQQQNQENENENQKIKNFFQGGSGFECLFVRLNCYHFDNSSAELLFSPFIQLPQSQVYLQVVHLYLENQSIHNGGATQISKAFKIQIYLQDISINLKDNLIDTEGSLSLIECTFEMKYLKKFVLGLENNKIKTVPELADTEELKLAQLKNLQNFSLNISNNKINDNVLSILLRNLDKYNMAQQIQIDITSNKIDFKGINSLSQQIEHFKHLQSIKILLGENQIQQYGANLFYTCLLNIRTITSMHLDLKQNQILDYLSNQSKTQNINLKTLEISLSENTLSESGSAKFYQQIIQLQNLTSLKLGLSKITEKLSLDELQNVVQNLKFLETFCFDCSDLNQQDFMKVIKMCQGIKKLNILRLSLKTTTCHDLKEFAKELKKLDKVKQLRLKLNTKQTWSKDQMKHLLKVIKKLKRLVIKEVYLQ